MISKIVLTGAAGALGTALRGPLAALCRELVSTDLRDAPATALLPNETYVQADLADKTAIAALMEGAEIVVHFGAIVDEAPFEQILGPNIIGSYNIWETAANTGARRIVYASSIHAVGLHETTAGIDNAAPHRPDTFYGLAKCFTEDLGRMYWEKRGIESAHLRILSCTPEPQNLRALGTWLSYRDMVQLVLRAIEAPAIGFTVAYGVSNNDRAPVSNANTPFLGYRPQDNAEDWADRIRAKSLTPAADDMVFTRLGGPFAVTPLGQSGMAIMPKVDQD